MGDWHDSTPPMLPGSDDTRGESLEVGNIPVFLGAEIGRIVGALDRVISL
jgi:hypothetical protein